MTAKELKKWRTNAGITRAELASKLKVSARTIEAWEQEGRLRTIPEREVERLHELMRSDVIKIPATPELRARLERMAKERGVDPIQWAQDLLKAALMVGVVLFAGSHVLRTPSDWSGAAILATAKAGLAVISGVLS